MDSRQITKWLQQLLSSECKNQARQDGGWSCGTAVTIYGCEEVE